jgi:predicted AlkP superfamily pyrophosphatase or phosphodiesterase
MAPSFPSLTFPNHFTIVTGLYPESQGITGNKVYDSDLDDKINFLAYRDANKLNPKWWNKSEPIWLTAKNQNLKTTSLFWTGSEVWTRNPDQFFPYDDYASRFSFEKRSDVIVDYFDKLDLDFGTLYNDEPDGTGHKFGPNSPEYYAKIADIDKEIGYLLDKLGEKNLLDKMNIIIVSDHGMATMEGITYKVQDYIDRSLIDETKSSYGIVGNIYPKDDKDLQLVFDELSKIPNLNVYFKEDVPQKLNFKNSNRIGPIVTVANEGYVLNTQTQSLKGNHGFDNSLTSMRSIFLARGPDFKKNIKMNAIKNVDVYPLLCGLLKIVCQQNNGSISPFLNILQPESLNYVQTKLKFK